MTFFGGLPSRCPNCPREFRLKGTTWTTTLPNQVVRLTWVKPSLFTTKGNSAYGIQARSPFLRS